MNEFHADLAEYDSNIVGFASTVAGNGEVNRESLEPDHEIWTSARRIRAHAIDRDAAREHFNYYLAIEELRDVASQASHGRLTLLRSPPFVINREEEKFVRDLIAANPGLAPMLADHVEFDFEDLLPYVLLADISREALKAVGGEQAEFDEAVALSVLAFIEDRYNKTDPAWNLMRVAFLESLEAPNPASGRLPELLGPKLLADFEPWTDERLG